MAGTKFTAGASGDLRAILTAYKVRQIERFSLYREHLVRALNEQVLSRTPVWEGDTIVNWRWSVGAPTGEHRDPVDNGPPGQTSGMALGSEPRRGPNELAARQSMEEALAAARGQLVDLWLENNAEGAVPLEYGMWPTPGGTRTPPGGIVRVAVRNVIAGFLR